VKKPTINRQSQIKKAVIHGFFYDKNLPMLPAPGQLSASHKLTIE
jgi:hypothetical protein